MKTKTKIAAVLSSLFLLASCEGPFTFAGPWGQAVQDEDGNVSVVYTPQTKPVQGTK